MKALLRKRWFRITTSIVLAAAILLGAAVLIANRRGAELLQQELAAARAAGLPLTRAEMDADQPPPDRNAALHGILHEWELAMARPDEPGAKEVLAVLEPFQKPSWQEPWRKSRRPREKPLSYRERKLGRTAPPIAGPPAPDLPEGSAHFWVMDKRDGYGQDPASFLAAFERRHGPLIRRLQHDLPALPGLRRPLAEASPLATDLVSDRLASRCTRLHAALALRAEAALQTGQPALATESIVLALHLGAALGSRGPAGSASLYSSLREVTRPLKAGMTRHQWRAEDLDRITAALQAIDIRRAVQRDIAATALTLELWAQWKDDRHAFRNQGHVVMDLDDFQPLKHEFVREGCGYLMPRGWFDWNAADVLSTARECYTLAQAPGPLLPWWQEGRRLHEAYFPLPKDPKGEKKSFLLFAYPQATELLGNGAMKILARDQMLAACALEKYYVEHRTYPATLPPGAPLDPLLEKPFAYKPRKPGEDSGFALYSLGPNARDDGGSRKDGGTGDDRSW